jgi:hypothetical protein
VIGWLPDGTETVLTPMQEDVVRRVLAWHRGGRPAVLPALGRQGGKTVIMTTIVRYWQEEAQAKEAARASGERVAPGESQWQEGSTA